LTYRENVELLNNCNLLIGCSSGITWLNSSTYSKKIPSIQVVNKDEVFTSSGGSASVIQDYKNFNIPTDEIIEFKDFSYDTLMDCIDITIKNDIKTAKCKYNEELLINNNIHKSEDYKKNKEDKEPTQIIYKWLLFKFIPVASISEFLDKFIVKIFGLTLFKIRKIER